MGLHFSFPPREILDLPQRIYFYEMRSHDYTTISGQLLVKETICFDKPLLWDIKTNFIYEYNQGFRKKYNLDNIDISDIFVNFVFQSGSDY